ncbi:hypothetical protein M1B78_09015, partial [Bacteroides sp. KH569_7]
NKAWAWESPGFAHKKRLCQHFDTTSFCYTGLISLSWLRVESLYEAKEETLSDSIAVGNPAKVIRKMKQKKIIV